MADADTNAALMTLGPYSLVAKVGSGGMGAVYRAIDRRSGSTVAIKLLLDAIGSDPDALERFRREAHVASLLHSPYTVRTLEFGHDAGRYYLVSEFVEGTTLTQVMRKERVEPLAAISLVTQIALALDEAESRKVTHRDLKPDNVLISDDGVAKVADFGIASLPYLAGLTSTGTYVGTVAYSAPEQHGGKADTRSDIYSAGVILYELLTGRRPFTAGSAVELMRLHEQAPVPMEPLRAYPPGVIEVVRRALEKDPARRYQSAAEFTAALTAVRVEVSKAMADGDFGATTGDTSPIAGPGGTRLEANEIERTQAELPPGSGGGKINRRFIYGGVAAAVVVLLAATVVFMIDGRGDDSPARASAQSTATAAGENAGGGHSSASTATATGSPSPPAPASTADGRQPTPALFPVTPTNTPASPASTVAPPTGTTAPTASATRAISQPTPIPPPAATAVPPTSTPPPTATAAPKASFTLLGFTSDGYAATDPLVASGGSIARSYCRPQSISAVVQHANLPVGTNLLAVWSLNGSIVADDDPFASDTTDDVIYYNYEPSGGVPVGVYSFGLRANGATVRQGTIHVTC